MPAHQRAVLLEERMQQDEIASDNLRTTLTFVLSEFLEPAFAVCCSYETSPAEFCSLLARGVQGSEAWSADDEERWNNSKDALVELLANDVVRTEGKAAVLLRARPNLLLSARIITDARPVFNDARDAVEASLVVNTLRVRFFDGNESAVMHFSLDTADLEKLEEQIVQAKRKSELIREQQAAVDVQVLEIQDSDSFLSSSGDA
jgi:hypothetical protein